MEPAQNPYRTGNSPFPQQYLDRLYPKQQWQQRKDFGLHFLLALGTPGRSDHRCIFAEKSQSRFGL